MSVLEPTIEEVRKRIQKKQEDFFRAIPVGASGTFSTSGYGFTPIEQAVYSSDFQQMTTKLENNYCPNHGNDLIKLKRTKGLGWIFGGELKCPKCGFTVSGQ